MVLGFTHIFEPDHGMTYIYAQTTCIVVRIGNKSAMCYEIPAMDPLWVTQYSLYTVESLPFIVSGFQKVNFIHCTRPCIYIVQ